MAMSSWDAAIRAVLASEGGYVNHPDDPGGPTNWGITLSVARRHWKGHATADDVRQMPEAVARKIYRERYWNALGCDGLPPGVDYAVFDYGVNSGVGRAGKVLRRVLGLSDRTSNIDEAVFDAARTHDAAHLIAAICAERLAFLRSLKTFAVFGRGWTRRVTYVRGAALAIAAGGKLPPAPSRSTGKAMVPDSKAARDVVAGGAVATGAVVAASSSHAGLWLAVLAATIAIVLAIVVIWRWRWRARQEAPVAIEVIEEGHAHAVE